MSKTLLSINLLLEKLTELDIIENLNRVEQFYDDPQFPQFSVDLKNSNKYTDGHSHDASASGFSFNSAENALIKCLSEAAERFCLMTYRNNDIVYSTYNSLKQNALDPFVYTGKKKDRDRKIGWIAGKNLTQDTSCLIPAQLVFFNYIRKGELNLCQPSVSTGGAGGFDKESVLLNGIYEVVERDAFMNTYLNSISLPKMNLKLLHNKTIDIILQACARYKLEPYVFDATNDLSLPTYISVLVDRTGFGQSVIVGAKTSLNAEEAILGCMMEPLMQRSWLRRVTREDTKINKGIGNNMLKRAQDWHDPKKINDLNFLFSSSVSHAKTASFKGNKEEELLKVGKAIEKKGLQIYYVDITHPELRKIGYVAYKAIIPGLQPLYLYERDKKYINMYRLADSAKFFGKENVTVNSIPHPFL